MSRGSLLTDYTLGRYFQKRIKMPTWLQNFIRPVSNAVRVIPHGIVPALESLNAAVEIEKAKKAGLSTPESLKRAGSVVFAGIEAARGGPVGIASVLTPPLLRMAAASQRDIENKFLTSPEARNLQRNYIESKEVGYVPTSSQALDTAAQAFDYLDPTAWAARLSDMSNPELRGMPLGQDPNQNLERMKDFLLQKAKRQ